MALKLVTGPVAEPVTRQEAKDFLRIEHIEEDAIVDSLILAARQVVEAYLNRFLITQTWQLFLDRFPRGREITVPRPPLQSVTHLKTYDEADVATTFAATNYVVDAVTEPGRIVLKDAAQWPTTELRNVNGVEIQFVAGYGATGPAILEKIRTYLKMLIGEMWENREASAEEALERLVFLDNLVASERIHPGF